MKKLIVVTGASGFIGSCLVRHLNDRGYDNLLLVDNLGSSEKWKNLVGKRFNDLLHKDELGAWLERHHKEVEAIIHLGACSSTVEKDANYLLENNYRYTIRLAERAIREGIRFIYASSAATYGNGLSGFSDTHDALETYLPLNMYGYSKHLVDLWFKRHGLLDRVVGLKYFNVFGPNEYHKDRMASAVLKMFPDALQKGTIRLFKSSDPDHYPDGGQIRDFIYVKDAVAMTAQFLENDATGIFNIGSGAQTTWNQLAEAVGKALNKKIKIEYFSMPKDLIGKYQNYTLADMRKSKGKLEEARYTIDEAVGDYVQNYLIPGRFF